MQEIELKDLTEAAVAGTGVFDVLMRAARSHLEEEFTRNRIKGPEYANVYLGSIEPVLVQSVEFLLNKDKAKYEAELIAAQIRESEAKILLVEAQTELTKQQKLNAENEWLLLAEQKAKMIAETALILQQKDNLEATLPQILEQTALITQQRLNAITEELIMHKQMCKLDAEYDLIMGQISKTTTETGLLAQKIQTEKAQTTGAGTTEDSVIGKQKNLYQAQADGFKRNAEQSAAKLMIDSWNTRRITDEGTVADSLNQLNDAYVGRTVSKLLSGIDA